MYGGALDEEEMAEAVRRQGEEGRRTGGLNMNNSGRGREGKRRGWEAVTEERRLLL